MGMKNAYSILVGKSQWKGQLERSRRRWEENFQTYFREIGHDAFN
jgi:hypothetical protein